MNNEQYIKHLASVRDQGVQFVIAQCDETLRTIRLGGKNNVTVTAESSVGGAFLSVAKDQQRTEVSVIGDRKLIVQELKTAASRLDGCQPQPWFKGYPEIGKKRLTRNSDEKSIDHDVRLVRQGLRVLQSRGFNLSGAVTKNDYNYRVYGSQSKDLFNDQLQWLGSYRTIVMMAFVPGTDLEARIVGVGRSDDELQPERIFTEARDQLLLERELPTQDVEPGNYRVALSYRAFPDLLLHTAYMFDGDSFERGVAGVTAPVGTQLFSPLITLTSSPSYSWLPLQPLCDMLGAQPAKDLAIVENGILANRWYTTLGAQQYSKESNGIDRMLSPLSLCLEVGSGPNDLVGAAKELGDGLIFQDLHYLSSTDFSGGFSALSRGGGFIVREGRLVARLPTKRVLDSAQNLFKNVLWLSEEDMIVPNIGSYGIAPQQAISAPRYVAFENVHVMDAYPKPSE